MDRRERPRSRSPRRRSRSPLHRSPTRHEQREGERSSRGAQEDESTRRNRRRSRSPQRLPSQDRQAVVASGARDADGPPLDPPPRRTAPISLEEMLQKKKEQEDTQAKPKFLTKAERQAIALQKRQEEADAKRSQVEEQHREREALESAAREQERHKRDRERLERERRRQEWEKNDGVVRADDREKEAEMDAIKARYLGAKEQKRKIRRMNERKFVFDWDTTEDTSNDYNPL